MQDHISHVFKVLLVGDMATGKTSIVRRYVHNKFSHGYRATIGIEFALKEIPWNKNTTVKLQLWDIAGQERYGHMTSVYYRDAVGAFIIFDLTSPKSFESVLKWKNDIDSKVFLNFGNQDDEDEEEPIPCVLIANKCDKTRKIEKTKEDIAQFAKENNFVGYFECSAKTGDNIAKAGNALVKAILDKIPKEDGSKSGVDQHARRAKNGLNLSAAEANPADPAAAGRCCGGAAAQPPANQ